MRRSRVTGCRGVDIAQATLAVRGKGRTSKQILSVPEATRSALQAWLDARGQEPGALFTNFDRAKEGKRLTGVSLYRVVRGLGQSIGLKVRRRGGQAAICFVEGSRKGACRYQLICEYLIKPIETVEVEEIELADPVGGSS
jgi:hypothetical protein